MQKAINFAARIVTGLSKRDHISAALEALEWPKFDKMLEDRDIAMLRRILSSDAPPSLAGLVMRRSDVNRRLTRGTCGDQLDLPKIRTERGRRTFHFRAVKSWNGLHR